MGLHKHANAQYMQYLRSEKWHQIAAQRVAIDGGVCQCCGTRGTATNPLEIHHLSYASLYHEEGRIYEDLVCLCHLCHKGLHNIMNRTTSPTGRRGWSDNPTIPQVHAFNLSGNLEFVEVRPQ